PPETYTLSLHDALPISKSPVEWRVAVIPGDHIGREVVPEALKVLDALAPVLATPIRTETFEWGADHYFATGAVMPPDGPEILRADRKSTCLNSSHVKIS